jgi:hypothetical protein
VRARKPEPVPDVTQLSDAEVYAEARKQARHDPTTMKQLHQQLELLVTVLTAAIEGARTATGVSQTQVFMALGEVFVKQLATTDFTEPPLTREQYADTWWRIVRLRLTQLITARTRPGVH